MAQNKVYIIIAAIYVLVIGYDIFNWFRYRKLSSKELRFKKLRSTVNFLVLITGFTLIIFAICFHVNIFNYSGAKTYDQVNELTLKDFKGFKTPGETLHGSKEFAFIVTSIEYEINDDAVSVRSLFHPSRSYVYNEKLVDKSLLRHELYHFHVTELFARKIRKQLKELSAVPSNQQVREIIGNFEDEKNEMQRAYDHDSYHSYVLKEQKKWENKIDSLLTLHQDYIDPTITFKR